LINLEINLDTFVKRALSTRLPPDERAGGQCPRHAPSLRRPWLQKKKGQVSANYAKLALVGEETSFPTGYFVERAFRVLLEVLTEKGRSLGMCERGDIEAKLIALLLIFLC